MRCRLASGVASVGKRARRTGLGPRKGVRGNPVFADGVAGGAWGVGQVTRIVRQAGPRRTGLLTSKSWRLPRTATWSASSLLSYGDGRQRRQGQSDDEPPPEGNAAANVTNPLASAQRSLKRKPSISVVQSILK